MIEFYTVVDVTNGVLTARSNAGAGGYYRYGKVHCFDNQAAAKSRRTLLANKHPDKKFAIFVTVIRDHGAIGFEWLTDVTFTIRAGDTEA